MGTALRIRRLLLAAGAAALLAGCATNAVTGRSQLALFDDAALASSADAAWVELKQKTPVSRDQAAQARVRTVGQRIANAAGLGGQQWEFVVFDTPDRNAFVLPGGRVGVYKGLLDLADSDAQLAAVLGHEVAHVTARHASERASQTALTQTGLAVGQGILGGSQRGQMLGAALGLGAQVGILLPYSRLHETEADRVGIDYMVKAGYDPRGAVSFWQKMQAAAGGGRPPQFLSTHPAPENRIQAIQDYIAAQGY